MSKKQKKIIIFFGPPGSGKGTQAELLEDKIRQPKISPGALLRHEMEMKSEIGKKAGKFVKKGRLVPIKIIEVIIDKRLAKKDLKNGYILDGYPRNKKQLELLKKRIEKNSKDKIIALYIKVSDKEVLNRMGGRRVCDCGATYHIKFNPPQKKNICDECGDKLYIRNDDKPQVVKKRLLSFYKETNPLLDYFEKVGKLLEINGEQSINKVFRDIVKKLKI